MIRHHQTLLFDTSLNILHIHSRSMEKEKLELVHSFCCKVAESSPNFLQLCKGGEYGSFKHFFLLIYLLMSNFFASAHSLVSVVCLVILDSVFFYEHTCIRTCKLTGTYWPSAYLLLLRFVSLYLLLFWHSQYLLSSSLGKDSSSPIQHSYIPCNKS